MNKNNHLILLKRQKEHKKQFPFRPIRKLNHHQKKWLKNNPYVLDESIVYFSTWDTSDFIICTNIALLLTPSDFKYFEHPFFIAWNRTTSEKSGIFTINIDHDIKRSCEDYIKNPQSFNDERIKLSDDELSLLIKCMKQYVEYIINPIAMQEARKKVFLDR